MYRFSVFKTWVIFLVLSLSFLPQTQARYKARVPHTIQFICEEGEDNFSGVWGMRVIWNKYPDALGYDIISHHGAHGGGSVGPDVQSWGIGGGSPAPPGSCPAIEAMAKPGQFQTIYEVWGNFPDGGNLQLHKTSNIYGAARPGDEVRYFLLYKNTGRYPLEDCIVTESWPPYMEFVAGGDTSDFSSATWNFGTLNPGHWKLVELVLRISEDLPREITEIYNVAVVHPANPPSPDPETETPYTTSPTHGIAMSQCDSLRCNTVYGEAEWIDRPGGSTFKELKPYDVVRGNDKVRLLSGYASFNHTVATGVLLLHEGGFRLTNCPDLPDNVYSEIILDTPAALEHTIEGIMEPDDHVKVVGRFLTLEIHQACYSLVAESNNETVNVKSGKITVIDPTGKRHKIGAGNSFSWPTEGGSSNRSNGPIIVGTDPPNFASVFYVDIVLNYEFDQPVTSIGDDSGFFLGETAGAWQGYGTFDELAGNVNVTWNTEQTIMTITIPSLYYWLGRDGGGMTLIATVHLTDVEGASGTTEDIYHAMTLFCTQETSSLGWANYKFDYFSFVTQGDGYLAPRGMWNLQQLSDLPGPLPDGVYQASPAYEFEFLGTILSCYWLQLKSNLPVRPPTGPGGGGVYSWNGTGWNLIREGFGPDWTWTTELTDPHQILVLGSTQLRPDIPEVISISPSVQSEPVTGAVPIVIQLAARSGIRYEFADIRINGQRSLFYDPISSTVSGWTVDENNGITTLTSTPTVWKPGQLVYGQYYLPARFGFIPAEGTFAFQVDYSDKKTDSDGDGMPDTWEYANGLDSSVYDRDNDPDGDGFGNYIEYLFMSNPTSSASLPAIPTIDLLSNQKAYYKGDDMAIRARVTNGPYAVPVDLYVVLELLGGYYFWPTFTTDFAPISFTMPQNIDLTLDLFTYTWEEIPMVLELNWYGAILDPQSWFLYSMDTLSVLLDL
ncbi:MAG: hypothetical protein WBM02_02330 [bacterium]